jgi:hypothetical protein
MDKHLQELLQQEDQKRRDEELRRTYALSQKSQGAAVFLSLLLAFAAYIYTRAKESANDLFGVVYFFTACW